MPRVLKAERSRPHLLGEGVVKDRGIFHSLSPLYVTPHDRARVDDEDRERAGEGSQQQTRVHVSFLCLRRF